MNKYRIPEEYTQHDVLEVDDEIREGDLSKELKKNQRKVNEKDLEILPIIIDKEQTRAAFRRGKINEEEFINVWVKFWFGELDKEVMEDRGVNVENWLRLYAKDPRAMVDVYRGNDVVCTVPPLWYHASMVLAQDDDELPYETTNHQMQMIGRGQYLTEEVKQRFTMDSLIRNLPKYRDTPELREKFAMWYKIGRMYGYLDIFGNRIDLDHYHENPNDIRYTIYRDAEYDCVLEGIPPSSVLEEDGYVSDVRKYPDQSQHSDDEIEYEW